MHGPLWPPSIPLFDLESCKLEIGNFTCSVNIPLLTLIIKSLIFLFQYLFVGNHHFLNPMCLIFHLSLNLILKKEKKKTHLTVSNCQIGFTYFFNNYLKKYVWKWFFETLSIFLTLKNIYHHRTHSIMELESKLA